MSPDLTVGDIFFAHPSNGTLPRKRYAVTVSAFQCSGGNC